MARDKSDDIAVGTLRIGAARMTVRAIGLVSTVVTARLLTPADFGLVAIAASVQAIIMAGTEFGFNYALIQFQDAEEHDYCTAWTLNVLRGIALALVLVALAQPLARFLDARPLFWILMVLALNPFLEGFENTWFIGFEKKMQFSPASWLMIAVKLSAAVTTVALAIATRSYWALIAGMVVSTLFKTVATHIMCPGPQRFTLKGWRRLMAFSGWLAGSQVLGTMATKLDDIILQKIMAAHAVGIFYTARELTTMVFTEIAAPLRRALFPALSRLQAGSDEFRQLYLLSMSGLFMILAPLGIGLALVAGDVVPLLLGPQWHEAIAPIRWLALLLALQSVGISALSSIIAAGATKMLFWRNFIFLPIRIALFIAGALWAGLPGAVYGFVAGGVVDLLLNLSIAQLIIGDTLGALLLQCSRTFAALGGMALAVATAQRALPHVGWLGTDWSRLGVSVVLGATSYIGLHLLLWQARGRPSGPEQRLLRLVARLGKHQPPGLPSPDVNR